MQCFNHPSILVSSQKLLPSQRCEMFDCEACLSTLVNWIGHESWRLPAEFCSAQRRLHRSMSCSSSCSSFPYPMSYPCDTHIPSPDLYKYPCHQKVFLPPQQREYLVSKKTDSYADFIFSMMFENLWKGIDANSIFP